MLSPLFCPYTTLPKHIPPPHTPLWRPESLRSELFLSRPALSLGLLQHPHSLQYQPAGLKRQRHPTQTTPTSLLFQQQELYSFLLCKWSTLIQSVKILRASAEGVTTPPPLVLNYSFFLSASSSLAEGKWVSQFFSPHNSGTSQLCEEDASPPICVCGLNDVQKRRLLICFVKKKRDEELLGVLFLAYFENRTTRMCSPLLLMGKWHKHKWCRQKHGFGSGGIELGRLWFVVLQSKIINRSLFGKKNVPKSAFLSWTTSASLESSDQYQGQTKYSLNKNQTDGTAEMDSERGSTTSHVSFS